MRNRYGMLCCLIAGILVMMTACSIQLPDFSSPSERPPTRTRQPVGEQNTPRPPRPTDTQAGPDSPTRPPRPTATESQGPMLRPTQSPSTGMIAGDLSYPSEWIPPLRVVAFDVNTMVAAGSLDTQENDSFYTLSLPVGTYYVVAYTMDGLLAGGYTEAVPCGLTVACTDHSLIAVQVLADMSVPDIDPGDWYAPPGTFPPMP
jgi:hypothetical protein